MDLPNLRVIPSFVFDVVQLEADGVHLNPITGVAFLEFVSQELRLAMVHASDGDVTLTDPTIQIVESDSDENTAESDSEADRLGSILKIVRGNSKLLKTVQPLKDSFSLLLQRTDSLEAQVRVRRQRDNYVFARMKEESDAELNKSREDRVVISGLDRFAPGLTSHAEKKEYYRSVVAGLIELACSDVDPRPAIVDTLVNLRREQVNPVVECRFDSQSNASSFRRAAAALAKAKNPQFSKLFFSNSVTQATRVRIEIMRAIAKKLTTESESGYVQGFISKPVMHYMVKESMPSFCAGTGRSYNFVDAVSRYGDLLMPTDLAPAYRRAGDTFKGSMEHYFIVLKDDLVNFGVNQMPLGRRDVSVHSNRGRQPGRGLMAGRGIGRGLGALGRGAPLHSSSRKRAPDQSGGTPSKRQTTDP